MAAGEYISEHLQADTEKADLSRERSELESDPRTEPRELTAFNVARGLTPLALHYVLTLVMSSGFRLR